MIYTNLTYPNLCINFTVISNNIPGLELRFDNTHVYGRNFIHPSSYWLPREGCVILLHKCISFDMRKGEVKHTLSPDVNV